jgi:NTP pyrophosphatase (non-canonical NTP hydrolase)
MYKEPSPLAKLAMECNADSRRWFPLTQTNLFFMTACMAGEAGEAINAIKKIERRGTAFTPVERHEYVMELTDALIYLLNCFALIGADPESAYKQKRAENEKRFGNGVKR